DDVRDGRVRRDDEVVDDSDLLILLVEDGVAEHLLLGAPAEGHDLQLLDRHAKLGRTGNLGGDIATGYQNQERQGHECHALHLRRSSLDWTISNLATLPQSTARSPAATRVSVTAGADPIATR